MEGEYEQGHESSSSSVSHRRRQRGPFEDHPTTAAAAVDPSGRDVFPTAASFEVPVSSPRYNFRTRINKLLTITDSATSDAGESGRSPSEALCYRSVEQLTVRQGPLQYTEPIQYHAYACYRHGARQVHTDAVGYSSEGALVVSRGEISSSSLSAAARGATHTKRRVALDSAICLDPTARVPVSDSAVHIGGRFRSKYPGVRCPKNRKVRTRLQNDHFVSAVGRELANLAAADSDPDGLRRPSEPIFEHVPEDVAKHFIHGSEAQQNGYLRRLGLGPAKRTEQPSSAADVNSAAWRFAQLSSRMRAELRHAALHTDYMPGFIRDVECRLLELLTATPQQDSAAAAGFVTVPCRDGYARLITHGVAAYYKMHSASHTTVDEEGSPVRVTSITFPPQTKTPVSPPSQSLVDYLLKGRRSRALPDSPLFLTPDERTSPVAEHPPRPHLRRKAATMRFRRRTAFVPTAAATAAAAAL